jgi:hypothetical protein
MATALHQSGKTITFPGGSQTFWAPQQQQYQDPSGVLYQLPGQMLQSTAQNYASMTGGLGGIGQSIGGMAGQHSSALSGLGNAMAQNYGAFGNATTGIADAAAKDAIGYYQSLGGAAGANQSALSNIWTQALSSLGGMGNALAEGMGRGQTGYQQALAGMQGANQSAVSGYGQKRLDNIGRLGAADAISNVSFDFGGGGGSGGVGFEATGPGGPIASGSYGGGGGGDAGMSGSMRREGASMSPYMDALMDNSVLAQLADSDMEARDRLDRQQDLYRQDYSNMFGQGLMGMLAMGREGAGSLRQGMSDFYGNVSQNRPNFQAYMDQARQGFNQSSRDIRDVGGRMTQDYSGSLGVLAGLANQMGSGMREANNSGMTGMSGLLRRLAPTESERYADGRALGAAMKRDSKSDRLLAELDKQSDPGWQRVVASRMAQHNSIPLARKNMMIGGRRAI